MRIVIFFLGVLAASPSFADGRPIVCKNSPKIVSACFTFHGRLSIYNGGWNQRIWRVGTGRLLAIVDGADNYDDSHPPLPKYIESPFDKSGWATRMFAEFRVCPLTRQMPRHMQHVCVLGASHIFVQRPPD